MPRAFFVPQSSGPAARQGDHRVAARRNWTINIDEVYQGLRSWGLDDRVLAPWRDGMRGDIPGRVIAEYGEFFDIITMSTAGEMRVRATAAGRLRHQISGQAEMPHTGDFVALESEQDGFRIVEVLPRRTALVRKTAGDAVEAQVMAANVDTVLIMAALNQPLNTGRLERSLALVWDSGANPVVVLTKADLAEDLPRSIAEADDVAMGVPVLAISVMNGMGLDALDRMLQSGAAAALLGPSGVGKSTLLNYWLGETRQRVQAIRDEDGRGRHTTTHREIFRLANGALIVDIPGIREVGLWEGGTHQVFADIDALAGTCRFTDCQHDDEPGCAVQEAIDEGQLEQDRLVQYRKLERELAHLERKRSARARSEARQVWKQRSRDARQRNRVNKGRS